MKIEAFKGTTSSAYGTALATPIKFAGSFEKLENLDECPREERLSPKDELQVINDARKATAVQKARTEALKAAGYEAPKIGEDMEFTFKSMVNILTKSGKTEEVARQMANQNLGTNY